MIHNIVKDILRLYEIKSFVETGTFEGDTLVIIESWLSDLPHLKDIYGIDLWDKAIEITSKRVKKTQLFQNNSVDWLKENIDKMVYPAFFYLDAHNFGRLPAEQQQISNTFTIDKLLFIQELEVLLKSSHQFIVCIDDWNAEFNFKQTCHLLPYVWVTNSPNKDGRFSAYFVKNLDETLLTTNLPVYREE